jgi:hypothetical protein
MGVEIRSHATGFGHAAKTLQAPDPKPTQGPNPLKDKPTQGPNPHRDQTHPATKPTQGLNPLRNRLRPPHFPFLLC